ncbi:WSC-domain-containing protein [Serendipita vermifera]|nr:WSC-domain-containing protein [Serendipita vermifera]
MLSSKLSTLFTAITLLQYTNGLLFEPPSAKIVRRHASIAKRDHLKVSARDENVTLEARVPPLAGWTNAGCFTDNGGARSLPAKTYSADDMTNAKCQGLCDADGYTMAATEWGRECWCDNEIQNGGQITNTAECDVMCTGDATEVCGGGLRLTLWTKGQSVLESYKDWTVSGCFEDGIGSRILPTGVNVAAPFTPQKCLDTCASQGYAFAGLEYMHECYCANGIDVNTLTEKDMGECNAICDGDPSRYCGAGNRLILYANSNGAVSPGLDPVGDWNGKGCYTDYGAPRTLPNAFNVEGGTTIEKCTAICYENSFKYAGVEYGGECYCANTIGDTGSAVTDGCNMPCSGDSSQTCGGGNRINIYEYAGNDIPDVTTPTAVQNVGAWSYQNCYTDSIDSRTLSPRVWVEGQMTVDKCVAKCFEGGYKYAGLEYANECYCSNTLGGAPAQDGCDMACEGDSSQLCGGGNRLTVYQYTSTDLPAAATLLTSYGDWQSEGCFVDQPGLRALPTTMGLDQMTVGKCIDACKAAGFTVAGLEYASECYCGNELPTQPATEGCAMPCAGDSAHICGGGNRLSVYRVQPEGYEDWQSIGCSNVEQYAQNQFYWMQSATSNQACMNTCGQSGYSVASTNQGVYTINTRKAIGRVQAAPTATDVYKLQGCYRPSGLYTLVLNDVSSMQHMTVDMCTTACRARNLPVAVFGGGDLGRNGQVDVRLSCACGDKLPFSANKVADSQCKMRCEDGQACGDWNYYSAYLAGPASS